MTAGTSFADRREHAPSIRYHICNHIWYHLCNHIWYHLCNHIWYHLCNYRQEHALSILRPLLATVSDPRTTRGVSRDHGSLSISARFDL